MATQFPEWLRIKVQSYDGAMVVAGSRSLDESAKQWSQIPVRHAHRRGWCIIVSDEAGVAYQVQLAAARAGVAYVVLGCQQMGTLRHEVKSDRKTAFLVPGGDERTCFAIRDKALVELAMLAPKRGFLGLQDDTSRDIQNILDAAKAANVPGVLYEYDGEEAVVVERFNIAET